MDGKRTVGATIRPWWCGRALVWDATCPDTFALSQVTLATSGAGAIPDQAEDRKKVKNIELQASRHFVPVAIETSGVFGQGALSFIRELGHHLHSKNGDPQPHNHLRQRIVVAMQWGNTVSVLGTMSSDEDPFYP